MENQEGPVSRLDGPTKILLVEDDDLDANAFKRCAKRCNVSLPIFRVENGRDALDYLRGEDNPSRTVVILDLNMPIMSGMEFLDAVSDDPEISDPVVFILTTSDSAADVELAWKRRISGYMVKGSKVAEIESVARMIDRYCQVVVVPNGGEE